MSWRWGGSGAAQTPAPGSGSSVKPTTPVIPPGLSPLGDPNVIPIFTALIAVLVMRVGFRRHSFANVATPAPQTQLSALAVLPMANLSGIQHRTISLMG